jgi:transposase
MDNPTPKPNLTAADKEARRKLAIRKVLSGRTQADVADFLGVHAVTVSKWMKAYRDGGEASLADKVVAFLRDLLKHLRGKVVVIWDGGPNHQGAVIREFLRRNKRLRLERLPAYAPDLNPVEAVWSWLKWGRLANFVPDDLRELDDWVMEYLIELKHAPELLRALWERSDLPFPNPLSDQ